MKINWVEVDEIGRGKGHGVEFYHDDCQEDTPLAFIVDYGWLHEPEKEIDIEIVKSNCNVFKQHKLPGQEIVDAVKDGVIFFLKQSRSHGKVKGKISCWFNA